MSATGRGGQRSPADYYPTPAWPVRRLLEAVTLPGGRWLEPGAGEGHIIRAVEAIRRDIEWTAVEMRPECAPLLSTAGERVRTLTGNFLSADATWLGIDWERFLDGRAFFNVALGNPPFRWALDFILQARRYAAVTALLLRLDFLESAERAEFLRRWQPDVYVLPDRPSFDGEGTDSTGYAWFVWDAARRGDRARLDILASTPLAERKEPTTLELPVPIVEQLELLGEGASA